MKPNTGQGSAHSGRVPPPHRVLLLMQAGSRLPEWWFSLPACRAGHQAHRSAQYDNRRKKESKKSHTPHARHPCRSNKSKTSSLSSQHLPSFPVMSLSASICYFEWLGQIHIGTWANCPLNLWRLIWESCGHFSKWWQQQQWEAGRGPQVGMLTGRDADRLAKAMWTGRLSGLIGCHDNQGPHRLGERVELAEEIVTKACSCEV